MNGILRPIFVLVLSDHRETKGMRKTASMLSRVMIDPMRTFFLMYAPRKIGT